MRQNNIHGRGGDFRRGIRCVAPGIVAVILLSLTAHGDTESPPSPFERFARLTREEKIADLERAFEERLSFADNLYLEIEIKSEQKSYDAGAKTIGETWTRPRTREFVLRIDKDRYRSDYKTRNGPEDAGFREITCTYDARLGIMKKLDRTENRESARIDYRQNDHVFSNMYWIWLTDVFCDQATRNHIPCNRYIFPDLLGNKDKWKVDLLRDEKLVRIEYPYMSGLHPKENEGARRFVLDPEKNFMPVSGWFYYEVKNAGRVIDRVENSFVVDDSIDVDGIRMPSSIRDRTMAMVLDDKMNESHITVKKIERGVVKKEDTDLVFPGNMEIADAIKGFTYKTDASGDPIQSTYEPLYGPPRTQSPKEPKSGSWTIPILVGLLIGLLMVVLVFYWRYQRYEKSV